MRSALTLRGRLVIGIVALLAAVTVAIGIVSVIALQGFLTGRLDAQLAAATYRSQGAYDGPRDGDDDRPPASGFLALSGQPEGTFGAIVDSGRIYNAAVLDQDGRPDALDAGQLGALLGVPIDGKPMTVDLGEGLGEYRVVVQDNPAGPDQLAVGLPLSDVRATVLQLAALIAIVAVVGLAAAAVGGAFVVRAALRPLQRVAAIATRVAELPLDRGEVALAVRVPAEDADSRTEVGAVGSALNHMLEHVASALGARQASENRVRAFVANASHELRTPLASIRGYAELTRRVGHDLPPDVVHAIGRVESESVRMTALVEDLLLLARLDEGDRLEAGQVDLGRIVVDAVGDALVADHDHDWRVSIPEEPVLVPGDGARLHQVLANLLANARTHTPAGTTVTASVELAGGSAVVEVVDTGPGVDPAVIDTVFERFVRADSSRSRAKGSTGLGLAIVSAVVEAHGGRAEVESVPGRTVFRVILPLARPGTTVTG